MDILIGIDRKYLTLAKVMLCSIRENNDVESISLHIFHDNLTTKELEELALYVGRVHLYNMQNINWQGCPIGNKHQPSYITKAAYYRIVAPNVLSDSINKILYLDCDIIIRHSLKDLWKIDLHGYSLGAVTDMGGGEIKRYNRLNYLPSDGYYNSGVMLINLEYWRQHNIATQVLDYIHNNAAILFYHDQDALNAVLHGTILDLPYKYNVQNGFMYKEPEFLFWQRREELDDCIKDATIVHFTTSDKPWCGETHNPYLTEFEKYRDIAKLRNSDFPRRKVSTYQKLRRLCIRLHLLEAWDKYRDDLTDIKDK